MKTILPHLLLSCMSLFLSGCGNPLFLTRETPEPMEAFYVPERIRVALVLGSGGCRGMAHVGVIEELEKAGVPIDIIVGCSAGGIVGALYADNPCIEEVKYSISYIRTDQLLDIDLWRCRYGLSSGDCILKVLNDDLTAKTFDELKIPLIVVATDLHSGELVTIGSGNIVKALRATTSIPFVYVPCKHMGRALVDGAAIDPVPVRVAKDLEAEIIIAVDLGEILPKTYPKHLFGVASRSADIAFIWQSEACAKDADIIVRPRTCGFGTFNEKMKWEIYQAGVDAAHEQIPRIKKMMAEKGIDNSKNDKRRLHCPSCYLPGICQ